MKRGTIIILFLSLAISFVTALTYISMRNQSIMNKFFIVLIKSFYFNNTPVMSFSFIALGEYLIWETHNNSIVMAIKDRITERMKLRYITIQLNLMSLQKQDIQHVKGFINCTQLLHIRALRYK